MPRKREHIGVVTGSRLLYFDECPASCIRALEAADEINLPLRTISEPELLLFACRQFRPSAILAVLGTQPAAAMRVLLEIGALEPSLPLLIASETDISRDPMLSRTALALQLDARGSVRLGGGLRDLQISLLCAVAALNRPHGDR